MKEGENINDILDEKDAEDFVSESVFGSTKGTFTNNEIIHRDNSSFEDKKEIQKLDHDEKDHNLKLNIASFLKWLLLTQSTTIFVLVFLQGFKPLGFDLQDYTILNILVAGVLTESYFLVRIIVEHLFPKKDEKQESVLQSLISKIKN